MKIKLALLTLCLLIAALASGCGIAQTFMGGGQSGTVSSLWSDVPAMPGAAKANINLPPLANIAIQGFIQAANSDNSSGTKLDKFDFIGYETTDTPEQVSEFYTAEKMQAAGWNSTDTTGCQTGTSQGMTGGFCVFGKDGDAGKSTILIILPVRDDSTNKTNIFYVRFEGTQPSS